MRRASLASCAPGSQVFKETGVGLFWLRHRRVSRPARRPAPSVIPNDRCARWGRSCGPSGCASGDPAPLRYGNWREFRSGGGALCERFASGKTRLESLLLGPAAFVVGPFVPTAATFPDSPRQHSGLSAQGRYRNSRSMARGFPHRGGAGALIFSGRLPPLRHHQ